MTHFQLTIANLAQSSSNLHRHKISHCPEGGGIILMLSPSAENGTLKVVAHIAPVVEVTVTVTEKTAASYCGGWIETGWVVTMPESKVAPRPSSESNRTLNRSDVSRARLRQEKLSAKKWRGDFEPTTAMASFVAKATMLIWLMLPCCTIEIGFSLSMGRVVNTVSKKMKKKKHFLVRHEPNSPPPLGTNPRRTTLNSASTPKRRNSGIVAWMIYFGEKTKVTVAIRKGTNQKRGLLEFFSIKDIFKRVYWLSLCQWLMLILWNTILIFLWLKKRICKIKIFFRFVASNCQISSHSKNIFFTQNSRQIASFFCLIKDQPHPWVEQSPRLCRRDILSAVCECDEIRENERGPPLVLDWRGRQATRSAQVECTLLRFVWKNWIWPLKRI